ncbi:hypothetical protein HPB50_006325 [Hyalomma asiaticum]|uniref:Uncharacterized protein n=1 Tax=Hyalomma asiaticum TaxID=266040 RepID=A0ACB7S4J7_HYAAI|nr:hypothetical protein HPB50_006325 [Hyalomma asiaticum]
MSCVVPAPGVSVDGDDRWLCLHKLFLTEGTEKEPDVVVLGDYTVVVLSVGSNNTTSSAEAVAEGIVACTTAIKSRLPEAQVVVLKLLPCGQHPNSQRDRRRQINELLAKALKGQPQVQLVDLDPGLVRPDGTIGYHDMFDFLHLSRQGYVSTFEPLADLVAQLLREAAGTGDAPVATS